MTTEITAGEFLARFKAGKTDFRDLARCYVDGRVYLKRMKVETEVYLGELIFRDPVSLGSAVFKKKFDCGSAIFQCEFTCRSATFEERFFCGYARFLYSFDCGRAKWLWHGRYALETQNAQFKHLTLGTASIRSLHVGKGPIEKFNFEKCTVGSIYFAGSQINHIDFGWCPSLEQFGIYPDAATSFGVIEAGRQPVAAWIIQQYKMSGVIFDRKHAPPWLLEAEKQ